MSKNNWDDLEIILAQQIFAERRPVTEAVMNACRLHQDTPVQFLSLALASVAVALDSEWLRGRLEEQLALLQIYKTFIALSVDLVACDITGTSIRTCADLLNHWDVTDDPYFS